MLNRLSTAFALTAFAALSGAAPAAAQPVIKLICLPTNLTGTWEGDDGGVYRVRQKKNAINWVGMSGDSGASWTHILIGSRNGDKVDGYWADMNGPMGEGHLTLQVRGNGKYLVRTNATGSGFGGKRWHKRGC
jgi:hypothetical protein